jgi:hypothetical protein
VQCGVGVSESLQFEWVCAAYGVLGLLSLANWMG